MDTAPAGNPMPPVTPSWRARWARQVDRWMTSPALGAWAAANPLTRGLVRRRSHDLFDLMAGFVHSQVLLACVRLRLFERVLAQPQTVGEMAEALRLPAAMLQRLTDSAVALRLLERRPGGRLGLGALGAPVATHAGIRDMVEHNATLYADLTDPIALLRDPDRARMHAWWPYTDHRDGEAQPPAPAEQFERYSALMASSQRFVIDELLASHDFRPHRTVLDVGGGLAGWLIALAHAHPHLRLIHMDLPPVSALAADRIATAGLTERITTHPGSFTQDELPTGADLVTLVRVAHDHPDATVLSMLRRIHAALPPGGALLLAEPMAEASGSPAPPDPYYHFYLLAMGSGRLRTPEALTALLRQAGFATVDRPNSRLPLHATLLLARRAGAPAVGPAAGFPAETRDSVNLN